MENSYAFDPVAPGKARCVKKPLQMSRMWEVCSFTKENIMIGKTYALTTVGDRRKRKSHARR